MPLPEELFGLFKRSMTGKTYSFEPVVLFVSKALSLLTLFSVTGLVSSGGVGAGDEEGLFFLTGFSSSKAAFSSPLSIALSSSLTIAFSSPCIFASSSFLTRAVLSSLRTVSSYPIPSKGIVNSCISSENLLSLRVLSPVDIKGETLEGSTDTSCTFSFPFSSPFFSSERAV